MRALGTALAALLAALALPAVALPLPLVTVPRAFAAPADAKGLLAAGLGDQAASVGPLVRTDCRGMPEATTTARVARTADALLLLVRCEEPLIDRLVATQRQRDATVWTDDCVEVFVQRPGEPYRHFIVNALGTQYDELGKDGSWSAVWEAEARVLDRSWEVALALPWEALGGAPAEGEEWGLNLCRCRQAEPEVSQWSPTADGFHRPEGFGRVAFVDGPWPVGVEWRVGSRHAGQVAVQWSPTAPGPAPVLRVDGVETGGPFSLHGEGSQPVVCEASREAAVVMRALYVAEITPLEGALDAAQALLDAAPEAAARQREALAGELSRLSALAADASPAMAKDLLARAQDIALRASRLGLLAATPPGELAYGVESSLTKLLRREPFRGQIRGELRLDAARREMDACQLVVLADERPVLQLATQLGPVVSDSGVALPPDAFRVRRVGYVPTLKPSYAVDHVGLWPDPLVAATPFDVREGSFESLWVDVRVPPETPAGLYHGELRLTSPSATPTVVPVEVRVRAFTIPAQPSLQTAFGLSPGGWRVPQDVDAYTRDALEHRISPYAVSNPKLVSPPAMDWRGARRVEAEIASDASGELWLVATPAEGSPIIRGPIPVEAPETRAAFDLDGVPDEIASWHIELQAPGSAAPATLTARLVRATDVVTLVDAGRSACEVSPDGWLSGWAHWDGSAWDRPNRPAVWDWSDFDAQVSTYLPLGLTAHIAGLGDPKGGWARSWEEHLAQRGWLDLAYTYLFDEPTPDKYALLNAVMGDVKRAAPGIRSMMTAREFPPELHYVDIWCPEAYSFNPDAARAEQAKGKAVWWYVAFSTRHPYPNVWVDYPALDCRVWPWMTWKHDLDGMLYWSAVYWSRNDPWRCAESFPGANGDGSLLYPGEDGKPVDSLRWECLRDGLEDYEVLALLDAGARELDAGGGHGELAARARAVAAIPDDVVRSYKDYNPDAAALLRARRQMSDTLEEVVAALGHEPTIVGRPRHRPGVDLGETEAEPPSGPTPRSTRPWTMPKPAPEAGLVLRYAFDDDAPVAVDLSGRGLHGLVGGARRCPGAVGQGLALDGGANVTLPGCAEILGARPAEGSLALWVCPDFEASELSADLWQGYRVIAYLQKTSGNGLPDGYNEVGLFVHGGQLLARCGGSEDAFWASVPSPLRKGQWTHLCLTWTPEQRVLYVDGAPAVVRDGAYTPLTFDGFPGRIGIHPASGGWPWQGGLDELRIYDRALAEQEVARLAAR